MSRNSNTEPGYWLEQTPLLVETLAAHTHTESNNPVTVEEVADVLATPEEEVQHPSDEDRVLFYIRDWVLTDD